MASQIHREDGPPELMTPEQVVSWNLRRFREEQTFYDDDREVHLTQEDVATLMQDAGHKTWKGNTVKELELGWQVAIDPNLPRRKFRLDELAELADLFRISIVDWFTPPPGSRLLLTPSRPRPDADPKTGEWSPGLTPLGVLEVLFSRPVGPGETELTGNVRSGTDWLKYLGQGFDAPLGMRDLLARNMKRKADEIRERES